MKGLIPFMTKTDKMKIALEYAHDAFNNGECPVGAAIFLDDELIFGCGSMGETKNHFLSHAEMKALWEADKKGYTVFERKRMQLYTTLEPCMMCMGAAMSFFIGEIVYALESKIDGAVSYAQAFVAGHEVKEIPSYGLPVITGGILRDKSIELLSDFVRLYPDSPSAEFCRSLINSDMSQS
jgi:tRNA(adenine34) deaminase